MLDPKRAPDLDTETPGPADPGLVEPVAFELAQRFDDLLGGRALRLEGKVGPGAAWLCASIGPTDAQYVLELFVRHGETMDEGVPALSVLIDYLEGILTEWLPASDPRALPLDFEGRPYELEDGAVCYVMVRGQLRNLDAEAAADALLAADGFGSAGGSDEV